MRIIPQFSVFLINKPGVLAQVVSAIAEAKVNVVALTVVDAAEHGVLRIVGDDPERLRPVLAKLNLPTHETEVLAVEMENRAGALAHVLRALAEAHINIDYAYVTAGAPGGRTTGILRVNHVENAMKVLAKHVARSSERPGFRTRPSPRRR